MKKTGVSLLIFYVVLFLSGCGNPFGDGKSVVDGNYGPPASATKKQLRSLGFDSPSAARISVSSTANKNVQLTAGTPGSRLRLVSAQNRLIYLNVQGQLISQ